MGVLVTVGVPIRPRRSMDGFNAWDLCWFACWRELFRQYALRLGSRVALRLFGASPGRLGWVAEHSAQVCLTGLRFTALFLLAAFVKLFAAV